MELNLGRFGPLLSDRLVLNGEGGVDDLSVDNKIVSWLARFVSVLGTSDVFAEENRRVISCVKRTFTEKLGAERLQRIEARYDFNLNQMELKGESFESRDLAKILTGVADVKVEDVEDLIATAKLGPESWPDWIPGDLRDPLRAVQNSEELSSEILSRTIEALKGLQTAHFVPGIRKSMSGMRPTEALACYIFDPFLADRERMELCKENPTDSLETYIHNVVGRIIGREPKVGMFIRGPNHPTGRAQYHRVSAEIVTGEGMVSYCVNPATRDTNLSPIRFYRGTAPRSSARDACSSLINDCEEEIGLTAHESGKMYEPKLLQDVGHFRVRAGHSLGSTQLEHALVEDREIRDAYLFMGPGIAKHRAYRFNARMREPGVEPVTLRIRDAHTDSFSSNGGVLIGFEAPEDTVTVEYLRHHTVRGAGGGRAHVEVGDRENRYRGINGGHTRAEVNALLNRQDLEDSSEVLRLTVGPVIAKVIRWVRDFFRWLVTSRTFVDLGLHTGKMENGRWVVNHYRPEDILVENGEEVPTTLMTLAEEFFALPD